MNTLSMLELMAPLSGTLKSIDASDDPVFAGRIVGDGVLIEPSSESLLAPFTGTITQLHKAGHAVALRDDSGIEVLMHIGIDTVTLAGSGFETLVALNDSVEQGQPLIRFDQSSIRSAGLSSQTAILVTTGQTVIAPSESRNVIAGGDVVTSINSQPVTVQSTLTEPSGSTLSADIVLPNPLGLHARPAAQLAQVAKNFDSTIRITHLDNDQSANACSVTALMGLQTQLNSRLKIDVTGEDASEALVALVDAIQSGLGENIAANPAQTEPDFPEEDPLLVIKNEHMNQIKAIKAAGGLAAGPLVFINKTMPDFPEQGVSAEDEQGQFDFALSTAERELTHLVESLKDSSLAQQVEVFEAHAQLLHDPALLENTQAHIANGKSAMWSWQSAYQAEADKLSHMNNPLLKARAADIIDVGERVLRLLLDVEDPQNDLPKDAIIVMEDITPSEIVALGRAEIAGLLTFAGGSTSHAAILAGALGLPYLVGVDRSLCQQASGTQIILNANLGYLQIAPSATDVAEFLTLKSKFESQLIAAQRHAAKPAITRDGTTIEVAANVANVNDALAAKQAGADGIGLVRSEFLYLDRAIEPSFAEQTDVYRSILSTMGSNASTIIRTLDVGGDKPLPYMPLGEEENPFLGERGIRIGLNRPHTLRKQVRAILEAASEGNVRIMFPMIASLEEFRAARALVREEQEKLNVTKIEVGVMIEVPSAALMADKLAEEADFFSIGTNDLTQYTLAMDRGHPKLAAQVDALHPAVLRLIATTVEASRKAGKWTGICGSIASDPSAAALLIGLGVTELSCTAPALPLVKDKIRSLHIDDCKVLARSALNKSTAEDVRALIATQ